MFTRTHICESCSSEYRANAPNQRWCRTCNPNPTFHARLINYGVSKPMWDKMFEQQGGTCALCTEEPTMVDHDHETDVVRGLLCRGCNIAMNRVDVPGWAEKAAEYVVRGKN